MTTDHSATVESLHTYPVKGEPGVDHEAVRVTDVGLDGDRRKKAAVQVIASDDVAADTRANVVVAMASDELGAAIGAHLRVGEVELEVTGPAGGCPGVYAAVRRSGTIRLGDLVAVDHGPGNPVTAVGGAS